MSCSAAINVVIVVGYFVDGWLAGRLLDCLFFVRRLVSWNCRCHPLSSLFVFIRFALENVNEMKMLSMLSAGCRCLSFHHFNVHWVYFQCLLVEYPTLVATMETEISLDKEFFQNIAEVEMQIYCGKSWQAMEDVIQVAWIADLTGRRYSLLVGLFHVYIYPQHITDVIRSTHLRETHFRPARLKETLFCSFIRDSLQLVCERFPFRWSESLSVLW